LLLLTIEDIDDDEQEYSAPLVIAKPEITAASLTDQDEFLLLACDGLYDVTTNEAAVASARAEISKAGGTGSKAKGRTAYLACEALAAK
jgi:protein phosphatase 2C